MRDELITEVKGDYIMWFDFDDYVSDYYIFRINRLKWPEWRCKLVWWWKNLFN